MQNKNTHNQLFFLLGMLCCFGFGVSHSYANTNNDSIVNTNSQRACKYSNDTLREKLESTLFKLYKLGYRQMPQSMQELLLANSQLTTRNSQPIEYNSQLIFSEIDNRIQYLTLSNNTFPEIIPTTKLVAIGNTTLDIQTHKISNINTNNNTNITDPITFALSIDPMAAKYPSMSPYNAMGNDPINMIDPDGKEYTQFTKDVDPNTGNITYIMKEKIAVYVTPEEMASLEANYNGRATNSDLIREMVKTELETTFTSGATRTETLEDGSTRTFSIRWSKEADVTVVTDPSEASSDATLISFGYSWMLDVYGASGFSNPITGNISIQGGQLSTMLDEHAYGRTQTGAGPLTISHEDGHTSGLGHSHNTAWYKLTGEIVCDDGISHTNDPQSYGDCDSDDANNHFFGNTFYFSPEQVDEMWRQNSTDGGTEAKESEYDD